MFLYEGKWHQIANIEDKHMQLVHITNWTNILCSFWPLWDELLFTATVKNTDNKA